MTQAIVLLPPVGHDGRLFASLAEALGEALPIRVYDFPAFGAVPPCAHEGKALLDAIVDDVVARIAADGIEPIGLGGVSLGGTLSLSIAERLETKPRALFLMGAGGRRVAKVRRETLRAVLDDTDPETFAREHLGAGAPEATSAFLSQVGTITDEVRAYVRVFDDTWAEGSLTERASSAAAMLRAALELDLEDTMRANVVPAAIIWGEHDRIFNRFYVERYAATLASSTLHVLAGVGHYPPLEAPREVARIMRTTLASLETP